MTGVTAARELCRLLADPARPYRSVWEQRGVAYRGRALNQTAIAKVIAAYLVDRGLLADFEEGDWPRSRRDWVRSRLAGRVLTHLELELFMDAFGLGVAERDRLRQRLDEGAGSGSPELFTPGPIRLAGLPDRTTYAVDRVLDEHTVGASGLPTNHRTTLTLRALDAQVSEYLYLFDADTVSVDVVKGGSADQSRQVGDGLFAVVITLDEPLARGDSCELTFDTTFAYAEVPPPVVRRAASADRTEIDMTVSFHPDRLPRAVHLSTWAMLTDAEALTSVAVDPDRNHRVTATWTRARAGLVGFDWVW
jgi:hypothetical protein